MGSIHMTPGRRPILLLLNGSIHTMNPDQPHADAVAVDRSSGTILAVGDDAAIRALAGPLTETLDLRGRTVLPGFIDAHTHLVGYAQARLSVNLRDTRSEEEAVAHVRERAERTPPGSWILGRSWDKNLWPGGVFPTKRSLDAAVPHRPVALWDHAGHAMWASSEALRRAGITRETPEPTAGAIGRDADGEPDGMLYEFGAMDLVEQVIEPMNEDLVLEELRRVLEELRARGITGVHDIEDARSLRLFQRLRAEHSLSPRVLFYIYRESLSAAIGVGLEAGFGDDS